MFSAISLDMEQVASMYFWNADITAKKAKFLSEGHLFMAEKQDISKIFKKLRVGNPGMKITVIARYYEEKGYPT